MKTLVVFVLAFALAGIAVAKEATTPQSKLNFVYETSSTKCYITERVGNVDTFYHIPCNKVPAGVNLYVVQNVKKGCPPCAAAQGRDRDEPTSLPLPKSFKR